jgi:SAM-dependent methyltransferase
MATKYPNTCENSFEELTAYYDGILNVDKTTYKNSNDEPTPIECIVDMYKRIPDELFERKELKILDPCCGNGNFFLPLVKTKNICPEKNLYFNDTNVDRTDNVSRIFCGDKINLNITNIDFMEFDNNDKFDLIVANPPYAKFLANGKRSSKNHNLIKSWVSKALSLLKKDGYILFITPDNWMSLSNSNLLIKEITRLQIIHLDIHTAKKYFKKIGSSFTWYVIQNCKSYKDFTVSGIWKKKDYTSILPSKERNCIPLLFCSKTESIINKTLNKDIEKFDIQTTSYLHRYTKKDCISLNETETFKHRLIHTPSQTVYSNKSHKFQDGHKVFISTTNVYSPFIDTCGMTQSIAFVLTENEDQANQFLNILKHPLYKFLNDIHRYGNFNNTKILKQFPKPSNPEDIYGSFGISKEEQEFILTN